MASESQGDSKYRYSRLDRERAKQKGFRETLAGLLKMEKDDFAETTRAWVSSEDVKVFLFGEVDNKLKKEKFKASSASTKLGCPWSSQLFHVVTAYRKDGYSGVQSGIAAIIDRVNGIATQKGAKQKLKIEAATSNLKLMHDRQAALVKGESQFYEATKTAQEHVRKEAALDSAAYIKGIPRSVKSVKSSSNNNNNNSRPSQDKKATTGRGEHVDLNADVGEDMKMDENDGKKNEGEVDAAEFKEKGPKQRRSRKKVQKDAENFDGADNDVKDTDLDAAVDTGIGYEKEGKTERKQVKKGNEKQAVLKPLGVPLKVLTQIQEECDDDVMAGDSDGKVELQDDIDGKNQASGAEKKEEKKGGKAGLQKAAGDNGTQNGGKSARGSKAGTAKKTGGKRKPEQDAESRAPKRARR